MYLQYLQTPLGIMQIEANEDGLTAVSFTNNKQQKQTQENSHTQQAAIQLAEYYAEKRIQFSLSLAPSGTPFQKRVWSQLIHIPFGKTWSYAELASAVHNPRGAQAVGQANGKNPIAVIIPCHRVIGKNGSLTGYAGGLDKKSWLLKHESRG